MAGGIKLPDGNANVTREMAGRRWNPTRRDDGEHQKQAGRRSRRTGDAVPRRARSCPERIAPCQGHLFFWSRGIEAQTMQLHRSAAATRQKPVRLEGSFTDSGAPAAHRRTGKPASLSGPDAGSDGQRGLLRCPWGLDGAGLAVFSRILALPPARASSGLVNTGSQPSMPTRTRSACLMVFT